MPPSATPHDRSLDDLPTEAYDPAAADLDLRPTHALVEAMNAAGVQDPAAEPERARVAMAGATESVITEYLDSGSRRLADGASLAPGVLYAHDPDGSPEDTACVTSLEMLAADGRPLDEAATCNPVRFRIGFSTARPYRSFSVVLQVSTADGVPLAPKARPVLKPPSRTTGDPSPSSLLRSTSPVETTRSFGASAG